MAATAYSIHGFSWFWHRMRSPASLTVDGRGHAIKDYAGDSVFLIYGTMDVSFVNTTFEGFHTTGALIEVRSRNDRYRVITTKQIVFTLPPDLAGQTFSCRHKHSCNENASLSYEVMRTCTLRAPKSQIHDSPHPLAGCAWRCCLFKRSGFVSVHSRLHFSRFIRRSNEHR